MIITIIRSLSILIFLIASITSFRLYERTRKSTNIWIFIGLATLFLSFESLLSILERLALSKEVYIIIKEYIWLTISITWAYIAVLFLFFSRKRSRK